MSASFSEPRVQPERGDVRERMGQELRALERIGAAALRERRQHGDVRDHPDEVDRRSDQRKPDRERRPRGLPTQVASQREVAPREGRRDHEPERPAPFPARVVRGDPVRALAERPP